MPNVIYAWHRNGKLVQDRSRRLYYTEGMAKGALKNSHKGRQEKEEIEIVEYMPVNEAREAIAELVAIYDRLRNGKSEMFDEENVAEICSPFTFNIKREE